MVVSVPYLRRRLKPLGDSFILKLTGRSRAEFHDFSGATLPIQDEFAISTPEILHTESEIMPVTIETTAGQMVLDFTSVELALETGQLIHYSTIKGGCDEYWKAWRTNVGQSELGT